MMNETIEAIETIEANEVNDVIVALITKDEFFSSMSPKLINNGACEDFAMALKERFPDGETMWGDEMPLVFGPFHEPDAHCFFSYGGKFYDSECPTGVDTPANLPFYRRQKAWIKALRMRQNNELLDISMKA